MSVSCRKAIPTRALIALLPMLAAIHNLEEYVEFEDFARRHGIPVSRRQIQVALGAATLLPLALTLLALCSPKQSRMMQYGLVPPAAFAVNAISHIGLSLGFREYAPGTATALLFNVPYAIAVYRRALTDGYLTPRQCRAVLWWGAALMAPGAAVLQAVGWLLARQFKTSRTPRND
jgi:hypothetical protein